MKRLLFVLFISCASLTATAQTNRTYSQNTISNMFYTNNIAQSNFMVGIINNTVSNAISTNALNFASFYCTTNAVVATSASTNQLVAWNYTDVLGSIGNVTNSAWITNAGTYIFLTGGGLLATGSDVLTMQLRTNGVKMIQFTATMPGSPAIENGSKAVIGTVPANTVVSVWIGNDSAASTTVNEPYLLIKSVP